MDVRHHTADRPPCFDESHGIIVVLLHSRCYRENGRIEDDVLGRKSHHVDQNVMGTPGDGALALHRLGWTCLSEAMTTTAGPERRTMFACSMNVGSPSL